MLKPDPKADFALAKQITGGSLEAWHEFIDRYTGLIKHSIVRVLDDPDEVATVYVAVLEGLYDGQLKQFKGESQLSTWLVFVARSKALDHYRRLHGRRTLPACIEELSETEQQLYKMRFEQGLSLDAIRHRMEAKGSDSIDLGGTIARIGDLLSRSNHNRLDWNRRARQVGAESGRFLAFLEEQRRQAASRSRIANPETQLIAKEAASTVIKIRAAIDELDIDDRKIISLRFDHNLSARQIADRLSLSGPRRAYTLIESAIRRVRRTIAWDHD